LSDGQEQNQRQYIKLTIEEWVRMAERKRNARSIGAAQKPVFWWAVPADKEMLVKHAEGTADA